jgi:hypothetical protein
MYKVVVENECSCFKKSNFKNNLEFEERQEAIQAARTLECRLNQEFCFKHYFDAVDRGDTIAIVSTLRPDNEHDDSEDLNELLRKNGRAVQVHFNEEENPNP